MSEANKSQFFTNMEKKNDSDFFKDFNLLEQDESAFLISNFDNISENVDEKSLDNYISRYSKRKLNESNTKNSKKTKYTNDIQQGGNNNEKLYTKTNENTSRNDVWKITRKQMTFKSNDIRVNDFVSAINKTKEFISDLYQGEIVPLKNTNKKIYMEIKHDAFNYPIFIPLMAIKYWTENLIWTSFENVCQSRKNDPSFECLPHHEISVNITECTTIKGGSKSSKLKKRNMSKTKLINVSDAQDFKDFIMTKSSIESPKNVDNFCLIRSILISIWFQEYKINLNKKKFEDKLDSLTNEVVYNLGYQNIESGIHEMKELEMYFKDYQIMVFRYNTQIFKYPIYLNSVDKFSKFIYIALDKDNHYVSVLSMKSYLGKSYYCDFCKHGYDLLNRHKCSFLCDSCRQPNCIKEYERKCSNCSLKIQNKQCAEIHVSSICNIKRKCNDCDEIQTNKNHVCGENSKWCSSCNKSVELTHMCYIQGELENEHQKDNKIDKFNGYIMFDFECMEGADKYHVVNLALAHKICVDCLDIDSENRCNECMIIHRFENIEGFCLWSLKQHNTIQIAHNLKVNYFLKKKHKIKKT